MNMEDVWDIIIAGPIVVSWGYGDVSRDQVLPIALKFYYDEITLASERQKFIGRTCERFRPYRVVAEIVEIGQRGWVIDFGIRAYQTRPLPQGAVLGLFVTAEVHLGVGIDEYSVRKTLDFAAIYHRWRIESITKEIAPLIPVLDDNGEQKYRIADRTRMTYQDVESTDGYSDVQLEDTDTGYVLHCQRVD